MSDIADEIAAANQLVARLRDVHSEIAALQAEETSLMTGLYHLRRAQQLDLGVSNLNAGEDAATEIGIALRVSQASADGLIALGLDLENRCPATREAFAAGRIDLAQTRAITKSLTNASDELLTELEPGLAAYAEKAEPQRIRRTARRRLLEADPAGQAARRKAAEADRYISITAHDDGTTLLDGVLPATGGQTLYERLREMASRECCAKDPRTTPQRRADALVALADGTGRLLCQCGQENCPRTVTGEPPIPRKALVQVGVSAETLAGLQDNPALLSGLGAIDPALARQIARHAHFEIITNTPAPTTEPASHAETGSAAPTTSTTVATPATVAEPRSAAATLNTTSTIPAPSTPAPTSITTAGIAEPGSAATTLTTTSTIPAPAKAAPTSIATVSTAETGSAAPAVAPAATAATTSASVATSTVVAETGHTAATVTTASAATHATTTHRATPPGIKPSTTGHPATTRETHNPATATATGSGTSTGTGSGSGSGSELRYRPGARTARQARAIDGTCRAPGCHIPAAASDLDHQDRFDHTNPHAGGHTTEDNLGARCRRHHRLKTLADNHTNGWTVRHHPGRVVEWCTPTGESVTTEPEGSLYLFPTAVVPPVTAAGVPDAEPTGSVFDPGVAVNILTELMQVYTTPEQRRQHARARASRRAGINR